jgi:hypothetical protein
MTPMVEVAGAGDGNRTRVVSLENWGSTIELRPHMAPDVNEGRYDALA